MAPADVADGAVASMTRLNDVGSRLAVAAGATGFSHVNDSGFWMISRYMGMSEKQTLKTWSIISTAISLVSFAIILVLSLFVK